MKLIKLNSLVPRDYVNYETHRNVNHEVWARLVVEVWGPIWERTGTSISSIENHISDPSRTGSLTTE